MLKHGHTKHRKPTKIYRTWTELRRRCNNPKNKDYKHYGGRGIKICKRWNNFENFLKDMGAKPEGLTIERINNDGNYEPNNCKWATRAEQNTNMRYGHKLTPLKVQVIKQLLKESILIQKDIAEIFGVARQTISKINTGKNWNIIY